VTAESVLVTSTYFFTTALVFSVVCMIGGIFICFIKCLDPYSV
jgi:hypothetical protein